MTSIIGEDENRETSYSPNIYMFELHGPLTQSPSLVDPVGIIINSGGASLYCTPHYRVNHLF